MFVIKKFHSLLPFSLLVGAALLVNAGAASGQPSATKAPSAAKVPSAKQPSAKAKVAETSKNEIARKAANDSPRGSLHLLGIRPGITFDSVERVLTELGATMRPVEQDTLSRSYGDKSIKIYVVDSIFARLTYMRFSLIFNAQTNQLRRFTITPRSSAIRDGRTDDIMEVLLLYFAQQWGKPDISIDQPASFRWRTGNLETRGLIRRGYPIWILEG